MQMQWHNPPPNWHINEGIIAVTAGRKTDFWRRTHDDGIRDSGHFYYTAITGDFVAEVKVSGAYATLYDQAGLMVRLDEASWLKCGIEYFKEMQHASVVVTRDYSDWSVLPLPEGPPFIWTRVSRQGGTVEVHYSLDGEVYTMLRQAYLTTAQVQVGVMCAAPQGEGFDATFEAFSVQPMHS